MYLFDAHGDIYTCWNSVGEPIGKVGRYLPQLIFDHEALGQWYERTIMSIPECVACKYTLLCGGECAQHADHDPTGNLKSPYCQDFGKLFCAAVPAAYEEYLSTVKVKDSVSLSFALDQAAHFLESGQWPEGCWGDFHTSAGVSTGWVTGYVGLSLGQSGESFDALARAHRWSLDNQLSQGGWAYHPRLPADADSTSWCLLFLARLGGEREALSKAVESLKAHQSPVDGGFSTYLAPSPIREIMGLSDSTDFSGWCSSQVCVTAVVTQALLQSGLERNSEEIQAALDHIRRQQDKAGYWEAYWWDGRMYSTCHCIKALKMAGTDEDERCCQKAGQWLLSIQLEDGSWNNGVRGEGKPFHTALAVQALLETGGKSAREAAVQGIRWLLQKQVGNGSWRSYAILRVPHPWVLCPWKEQHSEGNEGTGIIVRDQHRLFTTATVLVALLAYRAVAEQIGVEEFEQM